MQDDLLTRRDSVGAADWDEINIVIKIFLVYCNRLNYLCKVTSHL